MFRISGLEICFVMPPGADYTSPCGRHSQTRFIGTRTSMNAFAMRNKRSRSGGHLHILSFTEILQGVGERVKERLRLSLMGGLPAPLMGTGDTLSCRHRAIWCP